MASAVLRTVVHVQCLVGVLMFANSAHALEGTWYLGAGAGVSQLSPDTDGSDFTLDDESSTAATVYLGLDINEWLSVEAGYTDLGEALLSDSETIGYSAISLGAVGWVFGSRYADERQEGLAGYVRLGVSSIENDASVPLDESDSTSLWVGAGVQLPVGQHWGVRAELSSYDGDAQAALASIYWRSKSRSDSPMISAPAITPSVVSHPSKDTTRATIAKPTVTISPPKVSVSKSSSQQNLDMAKQRALTADCSVPASGEPTDADGCALFSGVLPGVEFNPNTAELKSEAKNNLDALAQTLNTYPSLVVEVQVHTDQSLGVDRSMQLSKERVMSVARYLAGRSVDIKRLRARAFGSSNPRASNITAKGRDLNNRVALKVQ